MNALQWLQEWYQSQCDGDWEHTFGIKITTIDNPGWVIKINISGTDLEGLIIELQLNEVDENHWYQFKSNGYTFEACGDPSTLETLILIFKKITENQEEYL